MSSYRELIRSIQLNNQNQTNNNTQDIRRIHIGRYILNDNQTNNNTQSIIRNIKEINSKDMLNSVFNNVKIDKHKQIIDNYSIIEKNILERQDTIDLTDRGITLICIFNTYIKESYKTILNTMSKIKFNKILLFTPESNFPILEPIKDYVELIKSDIPNGLAYERIHCFVAPKYIDTDYYFQIHHDSILVSTKNWRDEFLNYDYIGAPWRKDKKFSLGPLIDIDNNHRVGNSGFHIRTKKLADFLMSNKKFDSLIGTKYGDDLIIVGDEDIRPEIDAAGFKFSPIEVAKYFSYEEDLGDTETEMDKIFGIHAYKYEKLVHNLLSKLDEKDLLDRVKYVYGQNKKYMIKKSISKFNYLVVPSKIEDSDSNHSIITKNYYNIIEDFLDFTTYTDLSNKDIALVCVADDNIELSIKSLLNCMLKAKFKEIIFATSKVDDENIKRITDFVKVKKIQSLNSIRDYNYFVLKYLHNFVDSSKILICQHDGTIISSKYWNDDFLNYDYIGAPWDIDLIKRSQHLGKLRPHMITEYPKYSVGNSGFCIKSLKKINELLLKLNDFDSIFNSSECFDDCVICRNKEVKDYLLENNVTYAPIELALKFSYESDSKSFKDEDQYPFFGMHPTKTNYVKNLLDLVTIDDLINFLKQ